MGAPKTPNGPKAWENAFNALADYVESITPIGPGVTDSPSGKGRYIPGATQGTPAAAVTPADFSLYDASGNHATVGGLWMGVKFGNVTPKTRAAGLKCYPFEDYTSANGYLYEFAVTGDGITWVEVDYDTSAATDVATDISMGNGAAVPDVPTDGTADVGYIPLGSWQVDATVTPHALKIISGEGVNGIGNQTCNLCAGQFSFSPA